MKPFDEGCAANDEYVSLASGAQAGELIWDLLQHRIRTPRRLEPAIDLARIREKLSGPLQSDGILHIEAPAGYGKSQALNHALADHSDASVSWISLTAQDNDPSRLLVLLMLALKRPELRHQSLSKPVSGSLTDALTLLLTSFRADSHPAQALTLVLDGVDVLVTAPAVAILEYLVQELPEGLRLVLVSRQPLPIETHQHALEGRFHRVTSENLELTRPETLAFFEHEMAQGSLTLHAVEHVYGLTEGWLTPLALYRKELQSNDQERLPIQEAQGVQRFLHDALFARLTPGQQRSLCLMAEFDTVSDDLFMHIADPTCDQGFCPSGAAARGLPLRSVPGRGRWFRLNPLARDWLLARGATGTQPRARIASDWFKARGDYSEALRYALISHDVEHALGIASEGSEALLVSQDTASLLRLRRSLPPDLVQKSPRLRLVYGWVHAIGGQFREARKLVGSLTPEEERNLDGRVAALRAFILRGEGDITESLDQADTALGEPGLTTHARFMSLLVRSSALCAVGRFGEARSANRSASRLARESGDAGCEMLAVYDHARLELGKGYLRHAEQLLRHGLDTVMSDPARPPRIGEGRLQLGLALVLWHQGKIAEAARVLVHYARYAEQTRDLAFLVIMALRTLIAKAEGRTDEAFSWIGQAERTMQLWHVDDGVYEPVLEALKVTCWLSQEQYDSAGAALEKLQAYREQGRVPELFPMLPGLLDTFQVRHALACNKAESARVEIERLKASPVQAFGMQLYGNLLEALVQAQGGKKDKALGLLRATVEKASEEHYLSPFVELRYELSSLMKTLVPVMADSEFVHALKGVFGLNGVTNEAGETVSVLADPISEREQGVLELIAMGLSNQDIADKLHISLHTVKTHARRINAKLEVKSRTQAIVRARELGLL
ncbi:LuxR C-terminal-related transcriptional regulator [Marinobacter salicampi]|uniref:LuxR C-terminal-related transcriptional regulator n=1 Tax=Marinobacter salicampi TaxID=435907 RepID=UPI00140E1D60|nr:LuxR C-terminal-related transcriptional regulator [Marinobacter salicampi]